MLKTPENSLKNEIFEIIDTLKRAGKSRLADCIENNWDKTSLTYSKELNTWQPAGHIEPELLSAFDKELTRLDVKSSIRTKILKNIMRKRILQTAPHLGATQSPRMLCINWLGSLAVTEKDFYIVAMFSGIPFSNRSRAGRINMKKDSVNLFPSSLQDGLVYRSVIPEKLIISISNPPKSIKTLLSKRHFDTGGSYTKWALQTCQNIERKILRKKNLIYLDINEVVTNYLIQVLEKKDHIFHQIFFNPKTRIEFMRTFPNEIMFYYPSQNGKYEVMENVTFSGNKLKGKHIEINLDNPENLITELKDGRLCPALIAGFLVLAFLNEFKCLGSFAQVEYLPVYQNKLSKLKCLKNFNIRKTPTANLTTGVFPFNPELYPVDIINGEKFTPNKNILFGELLLPMKKTLLESYFTGNERKK
ncbi:MAG: hypothetical protein Q7K54_03430 [Candidatus Parcubacteria bacterium]|nr:hypothetical protein [Candidatus Parcubacteria bacterium]